MCVSQKDSSSWSLIVASKTSTHSLLELLEGFWVLDIDDLNIFLHIEINTSASIDSCMNNHLVILNITSSETSIIVDIAFLSPVVELCEP